MGKPILPLHIRNLMLTNTQANHLLLTFLAKTHDGKIGAFNAIENYKYKQKRLKLIQSMPLLKKIDSKLHFVCQKLKEHAGLNNSDDIEFRVMAKNKNYGEDQIVTNRTTLAFYHKTSNTIALNLKICEKLNESYIIFSILHELIHYKQETKESDECYHGAIYKIKESDADFGACLLMSCYQCLQNVADRKLSEFIDWIIPSCIHRLYPTPNDLGYLSRERLVPYIQRLQNQGKLCYAHQHLKNYPNSQSHQFTILSYLPSAQKF